MKLRPALVILSYGLNVVCPPKVYVLEALSHVVMWRNSGNCKRWGLVGVPKVIWALPSEKIKVVLAGP